jgi:hypothetical protein
MKLIFVKFFTFLFLFYIIYPEARCSELKPETFHFLQNKYKLLHITTPLFEDGELVIHDRIPQSDKFLILQILFKDNPREKLTYSENKLLLSLPQNAKELTPNDQVNTPTYFIGRNNLGQITSIDIIIPLNLGKGTTHYARNLTLNYTFYSKNKKGIYKEYILILNFNVSTLLEIRLRIILHNERLLKMFFYDFLMVKITYEDKYSTFITKEYSKDNKTKLDVIDLVSDNYPCYEYINPINSLLNLRENIKKAFDKGQQTSI